jgi:hypothetical protein
MGQERERVEVMDSRLSRIVVELPDSLLAAARKAAERDHTTLDRLLTLAIAEKLSALETEQMLRERAQRADMDSYREVLDLVPDVPPVAGDELPEGERG